MPPLRIAVVLPHLFNVRDFLYTPVWDELVAMPDLEVLLLGVTESVAATVQARGVAHIRADSRPLNRYRGPPAPGASLADRWCARWGRFDDDYLFHACSLRFIAAHALSHYRIRRDSTPAGRQRRMMMMEYRTGERPGFPFPTCPWLAEAAFALRESPALPVLAADRDWLATLKLDLLLIGICFFKAM